MSKRKGRPLLILVIALIAFALSAPRSLGYMQFVDFDSSFFDVLYRIGFFYWNWVITLLCAAYVLVDMFALGSYSTFFRRVITIIMCIVIGLAGLDMLFAFLSLVFVIPT